MKFGEIDLNLKDTLFLIINKGFFLEKNSDRDFILFY